MKPKKFDAQEYAEQQNKAVETYDVVAPSGYIFTLQRVDLETYFASGQLPSSYIEKVIGLGGKSAAEVQSVMSQMTVREQVANLAFVGDVVRSACVFPKIVENPSNAGEVRFQGISNKDIMFLFQSAIGVGGEEAERVGKFRGK